MDFWALWQGITDAQAQIISSVLTGVGILLGAWMGIGVVGGQVKKAREQIKTEARKQIDQLKSDLEAVRETATVGLEVARRSEIEQETLQEMEAEAAPDDGGQAGQAAEPEAVREVPEDFRQETAEIVRNAQAYVRGVAGNDADGRYQRTYGNIPDSFFDILAKALRDRNRFTADQADQAERIRNTWRGYQRGKASKKPVPRAVRDEIAQAYERMINP